MLDIIARIALFPVLAAQGIYVYRHALVLPDASGALAGQSGSGPKLRLLIVGDSSAAGVGTSHHEEALLGHMRKRLCQTHTVDWQVCAQSGATTQVMLDKLRAMPAQKFDVVSISLGVNDITKLVSCRKWCRQYRALLKLIETKFGAQAICVSGVPKMQYFPLLPEPLRGVLGLQAARYDRALQAIIQENPKCRFVALDFEPDTTLMSEDGYHPGPRIYAEWGRKVYRAIRPDIRRFGRDDSAGLC